MERNKEFDDDNNDDPETEYIIDPIGNEKQSIIYGLYSQLNAFENFFNKIRNKFKQIAITWLLASFIGIGFLLSRQGITLPFNPLLAITILSFAGTGGITLLWYLDIAIYHTYWVEVIIEESKLEKENKWLPQARSHMISITKNMKKRLSHGMFYIGCDVILLITMGLSAIFYTINYPLISILCGIITLLLIVFVIKYLMYLETFPKNIEQIKNFRKFD